MKIGPMVAITVMAGASTQSGNAGQAVQQNATVYVENDANIPSPLLSRARVLAGEMFASVGLQIGWGARAQSLAALGARGGTDQDTSDGDNESPANFFRRWSAAKI